MKKIILTISVLTVMLISACGFMDIGNFTDTNRVNGSGNIISEERAVSGFTRVELDGSGDIKLAQTGQESLVIEGEDNIVELVTTEVRGETLYIDFKRNSSFTTTKNLIFHLTMKDIEALKVNGSGDIDFTDLESENLEFDINGSGDVEGEYVDAKKLLVDIDGSGNIELSKVSLDSARIEVDGSGTIEMAGEVDTLDFSVGGSGDLRCGDLKAQDVSIHSSGSGTATVWAEETLEISVSGSGDVRYYGHPSIDQRVSGSGDIRSMGEK